MNVMPGVRIGINKRRTTKCFPLPGMRLRRDRGTKEQAGLFLNPGGKMSNNFKAIYRILKYLRDSMGFDEYNDEPISAFRLGITEGEREQLLIMMQDEGYIKGLVLSQSLSDTRRHIAMSAVPQITIRGMEYLEENSLMKKAANLAKGIAYAVGK